MSAVVALKDGPRRLLDGRNFAHIATLREDGSPHSVPTWIARAGDQIVFVKEAGSVGLINVRRDPRIAISIIDRDNPYCYCTVRGVICEERTGDEAIEQLHELAIRYTGRCYPAKDLADSVALVVDPQQVVYVEIDGFG